MGGFFNKFVERYRELCGVFRSFRLGRGGRRVGWCKWSGRGRQYARVV